MIPFDCSSDSSFVDRINDLRSDPEWLGSLIAAPYKQLAFSLALPQSSTVAKIKSANLIISSESKLYCNNTDGLGALNSIQLLSSNPSLIAQFGFGGTGKSVLFNLAEAYPRATIHLYTRQTISSILGDQIIPMDYSKLTSQICLYDLLVNTTSLGDINHPDLCAITPAQAALLSPNARLFDVIYEPPNTPFLNSASNSSHISNGSRMNLLQAFHAFSLVHPDVSLTQLELLDPSVIM